MSFTPERPTGHELVLSLAGSAASLAMIPMVMAAGKVSLWMTVAVVLAAIAVFVRRDSFHGAVALGVLSWVWLVATPEALSAWSLAVAVLLFTVHTTLAMRTCAPPGAVLSRGVVLRWGRRWAVVVLLTTAVFGLAYAVKNLHQSDAESVLALALVLVAGLGLLLRSETLDGSGEDDAVRASERVPGRVRVSGDSTEYRERDSNGGRGWL